MPKLKVKFSINKGRRGAPLAKLGKISEQAEKFLRALATDCQIETKPGEWLAANFHNGSVEFDAEFQDDVGVGPLQIFSRTLEAIADYDPESEGLNFGVNPSTAMEYARIGTLIDPDESIGIGIYPLRGGRPRLRSITYSATAAIRRHIETPIPSYGAAQGILHAWYKEAREPNFQLRELSSNVLLPVYYSAALYGDVADAVRERTTMLIVTGNMLFDKATRRPIELRADRIERIKMLSSAEFEEFFGSAPEFAVDFDGDRETYLNG